MQPGQSSEALVGWPLTGCLFGWPLKRWERVCRAVLHRDQLDLLELFRDCDSWGEQISLGRWVAPPVNGVLRPLGAPSGWSPAPSTTPSPPEVVVLPDVVGLPEWQELFHPDQEEPQEEPQEGFVDVQSNVLVLDFE